MVGGPSKARVRAVIGLLNPVPIEIVSVLNIESVRQDCITALV